MEDITIRKMADNLKAAFAGAGIDAGESKAMARLIIEHVKGYKAVDIALHGDRTLLPETAERMRAIARRVIAGEPLQYVLGKAYFHGRDFIVTPATLIPRPETSGLVDLVEDSLRGVRAPRILDVGTGSGCIAISLALDMAYSDVDAVDISADALAVASKNAAALRASVRFFEADARKLEDSLVGGERYDAIVSNPPYVMDKERGSMDARVAEHEPELALFVPDADPLVFYKAIAAFGRDALSDGGRVFFEINPLCASEMKAMLDALGYEAIEIMRDYKGALRYAAARK